ncbi:hypothetical protein [Rhizobium sp. PP-F2F-G48]|uniref:hypothetical protein n=1 Tax=Rhizobium sp. PP-F2F-G48 TaxID=2135651 RepID=UPI001051D808|nr:hypothetical protein [Rhizobium sp. PP-F2F-G48]
MRYEKILQQLEQSQEASRFLDASIALAAGYSRKDAGDGRSAWLNPEGLPVRKVPLYTKFVQEGRRLADTLLPGEAAAVVWDPDGSGKASVEVGVYHIGATPAIALCIAVLSTHEKRFD